MIRRIKNIILCIRFPFLRPRNVWTDKKTPRWFGRYTELDAMPDAWRKAFGIKMCKELKEELKKHKYLKKYRVTQIKEKYGSLRWYDMGNTERGHEIISKYEKLSMTICINCGKPAVYESNGWVSFLCEDCVKDRYAKMKENFPKNTMSYEEFVKTNFNSCEQGSQE